MARETKLGVVMVLVLVTGFSGLLYKRIQQGAAQLAQADETASIDEGALSESSLASTDGLPTEQTESIGEPLADPFTAASSDREPVPSPIPSGYQSIAKRSVSRSTVDAEPPQDQEFASDPFVGASELAQSSDRRPSARAAEDAEFDPLPEPTPAVPSRATNENPVTLTAEPDPFAAELSATETSSPTLARSAKSMQAEEPIEDPFSATQSVETSQSVDSPNSNVEMVESDATTDAPPQAVPEPDPFGEPTFRPAVEASKPAAAVEFDPFGETAASSKDVPTNSSARFTPDVSSSRPAIEAAVDPFADTPEPTFRSTADRSNQGLSVDTPPAREVGPVPQPADPVIELTVSDTDRATAPKRSMAGKSTPLTGKESEPARAEATVLELPVIPTPAEPSPAVFTELETQAPLAVASSSTDGGTPASGTFTFSANSGGSSSNNEILATAVAESTVRPLTIASNDVATSTVQMSPELAARLGGFAPAAAARRQVDRGPTVIPARRKSQPSQDICDEPLVLPQIEAPVPTAMSDRASTASTTDIRPVPRRSTSTAGSAKSAAGNGPSREAILGDTYAIEPNDNYWSISKRRYGDGKYHLALAKHNERCIPDPKRMRPGVVIELPDAAVLASAYPDLLSLKNPSKSAFDVAPAAEPAGLFTADDGRSYYRVGPEDTLSGIAQRVLGRSSRWPEIQQLNQDRLTDGHRLKIGAVLRIPANSPPTDVVVDDPFGR